MELVVVLSICASMAAIALPRMGNASARYRADLVARKISADLDFTRTNARMNGASRSVTFDVGGGRYNRTAGNGAAVFTTGIDLTASPYQASLTSASFGGSNVVTFDAFGLPSAGGSVKVKIGSTTRTVTLDASSGKATWK